MRRIRALAVMGCLVAAGLLVAPPPAEAQAPGREGNIVNGKNREPSPAEVLPRERQAGVAPARTQAESDQRTVDQLNQQLLGAEAADPPGRAGGTMPLPSRR